MGKYIGIDLGTTFSCVAIANEMENGKVHSEILENSDGNSTTPSVVFINDENYAKVGEVAVDNFLTKPNSVVRNVKRSMGTNEKIVINKTFYRPYEISSYILKKLIDDAEMELGDKISGAVVTCPAYFGAREKNDIIEACKLINLPLIEIINEPTAAAYAYAYSKLSITKKDSQKKYLVYDLGGGTFDCTILSMDFSTNDITIISSDGDKYLGGKEWDNQIEDLILDGYSMHCDEYEFRSDAVRNQWLFMTAESTKRALSKLEKFSVLASFDKGTENITITRKEFEDATEELLNKTIIKIDGMLKQNKSWAFDEIILVGGSTRMPQVEKELKKHYKKPITIYKPDEAVAIGAALRAFDKSKDMDDKGDVKLQDVLNKTYALKVSSSPQFPEQIAYTNSKGFVLSNIIFKNTPIPCENTIPYRTAANGLGEIEFVVYENEEYKNPFSRTIDAIDIFKTTMDCDDVLPKGAQIDVTFSVDDSGMLTLSAFVPSTKAEYSFTVELKNEVTPTEEKAIKNRVKNNK